MQATMIPDIIMSGQVTKDDANHMHIQALIPNDHFPLPPLSVSPLISVIMQGGLCCMHLCCQIWEHCDNEPYVYKIGDTMDVVLVRRLLLLLFLMGNNTYKEMSHFFKLQTL